MNLSLIIILNAARSQSSLRKRNSTFDLPILLRLDGAEVGLLILSSPIGLHLHNVLVYPLRIYQDVFLAVLRIRLLSGLLKVLLISLVHTLEHLTRATFLGLQSVRCVALG